MGTPEEPTSLPSLPPGRIVHQEGVLALVALVGLGLRDGSPLAGLAPRGDLLAGLGAGAVAGLLLAGLGIGLSRLPAGRRLEDLQRSLLRGWTAADGAAVALLSGLAEEALVRALLQPLVGLVPAALLFALLHVIPERGAWLWPVTALLFGLALGGLFARWGYPAAALCHATVNLVGFLRLSGGRAPTEG